MKRFSYRLALAALTSAMLAALAIGGAKPALAAHWDVSVPGASPGPCSMNDPITGFAFDIDGTNVPAGATATYTLISGPAGLSGSYTAAIPTGTYTGANVGFTLASVLTPDPWSFVIEMAVEADGETLIVGVQIDCPAAAGPYSATQIYKYWLGAGCATDGRINSDACAGPVALYCADDGLEVWDIDPETGEGTLAFTFSGSFETPNTNALLMQDGDIQLWQLDTGEFQVNADAGEGKTYAFLFNGCPYDGGGYNANLDPNE